MGMHMHLLGTAAPHRVLLKMMGYKVSKEEGRRYVNWQATKALRQR